MSITFWTRIEPRARKADLKRALQVCVRDPLWMLARQRQVGELMGDDAGSPVLARLQFSTRRLTGYQPLGGSAVAIDDSIPLEAHVEREPVTLGLRGSIQLGIFLENLLPAGLVSDFRQAFPIAPQPPAGEIEDPRAIRLRGLSAGRIADGEAAYQSFREGQTMGTKGLNTVAEKLTHHGIVDPLSVGGRALDAGIKGGKLVAGEVYHHLTGPDGAPPSASQTFSSRVAARGVA